MEEEIDLRELFLVLWRKKYFVGIITFGVTVISIIYAFSLPRIYETFATIMIIPSKLEFIRAPLDTTIDNNRSGAYKSLLTLDTHKNLLVSTTVLLKLLQNIGDAELTMDDIRSMLKVEEVKGTSLLTLKVRTDDKEKCKKIADFWVKIYLEESEKLVSEEGSTTMEFLYREYEANKQKLEEKERGYALFLEKSDLTVLNTQYGLLQAKLRDYQKSMVNKIDELKVSQQEIYDAAAKFNLDDAKYHADGDLRRMDPNDGRFDCAEAYYFVAKEMGLDVGGASNPSYLLTHVRATGTSASSFNDLPVGGMIYWHQVGSDPDNPPPGGHLHVGMKCGTNCVIDMASSGGWQQRTYSGYTNGKTLKGRKVEFIMPRSLNI